MAIALSTANGDSLSSFSNGNSQFSTGNPTNPFLSAPAQTFNDMNDKPPGLFSNFQTFGQTSSTGASQTTGSKTTATRAGSTDSLGFTDLTQNQRGAKRGGMRGGSGTPSAVPKLVPDQPLGIPKAKPAKQEPKNEGPSEDELNESLAANAEREMGWGPVPGQRDQPPRQQPETRTSEFGTGSAEGRPGGMPGMMGGSAANTLEDDL